MTEAKLTEQDQADIDSLGDLGDATQRAIVAIWREVFSNVKNVIGEQIELGVAAKVVASWPFLTFQETQQYHVIYHSILLDLEKILVEVLDENPDATTFTGDDDATENHNVYLDLLVRWFRYLDQIEKDWCAEHDDSHIRAAAIPDARAMIFSRTGLAGHLEAIGLEFQDGEFLAALDAAAEEANGE